MKRLKDTKINIRLWFVPARDFVQGLNFSRIQGDTSCDALIVL